MNCSSAERLSIAPGTTESLTITDLPATAEIIHASLSAPVESETGDYLAIDDVAYAVYTPPASGRVLLVTEGNLFLEQLLGALPNVEAYRARPDDLPEGAFDSVIFDGASPSELPATNLLMIGPRESTQLFSVSGTFADTRFARQADDPLLAFVDFEDVAIREASVVRTPGWAQTLVEADGGPLLLAGSTGGRRVAILTFDLLASDLPLKVSFPILVANLLERYGPSRRRLSTWGDLLSHPGESLPIRPRPTTVEYRVVEPDGTIRRFDAAGDTLTYTGASRPGIYRVELVDRDGEVTERGPLP